MTTLRFVGDLPPWWGVALALTVSVLAWRYYHRESFDLPRRLRWLLPLLRSAAFFLGIMILTGPVLKHRQVIGELGRVQVFLDGSQSMGVVEPHMPIGRKVQIAETLGWIPAGHVNPTLWSLAESLDTVSVRTLQLASAEGLTAEQLHDICLQFASRLEQIERQLRDSEFAQMPTPWARQESSGEGTVRDWLVDRFRSELIDPIKSIALQDMQEADGMQRAIEQVSARCATSEQFVAALRSQYENQIQERIEAGDELLAAAIGQFDATTRWERILEALIDSPESVLRELRQHHEVELIVLSGGDAVPLFDSGEEFSTEGSHFDFPAHPTTDLVTGVTDSQGGVAISGQRLQTESDGRTAIVLITDGRHNARQSPLELASLSGESGIAWYPVGVGTADAAPDLAVIDVTHPELVFQKDRVRGTLTLLDHMPQGQPFVVEVGHRGEVLWSQQLVTSGTSIREVEFDFSVDRLVEKLSTQLSSDVNQHNVPLALTASVSVLAAESETTNNERTMRLAAITESYRVLILDGRSRWETRYLRNVFQRDAQWEVDTVIAGPATGSQTLPRGTGRDQFPVDREALFAYDLIVFGDLDPRLLEAHEQEWLRKFVELRGGGLIFIDGRHDHLRSTTSEGLQPLLPVEWQAEPVSGQPVALRLTEQGAELSALKIENLPQRNREFWSQLPAPHTLIPVRALPGAQVLVETDVDGATWPVMVFQRYGAGRVLYLASDETWRWRYKAADTYHQRIWNQLAKLIMPRPFAVSDKYLSLDTGSVSYDHGDPVDIRVRLVGIDNRPAANATVDALIWKEGQLISTVNLQPDADVEGIYRGRTDRFPEGTYEVSIRASGFNQNVLKARSEFIVLPPDTNELVETTCHDELLQGVAQVSGGEYLREEQVTRLPELLKPLSSGYVVESETQIWQSYWWFCAIIVLLAVEWTLRKRAGLL